MLYDGWTMEKERRTRGNRIGVTSARLHSSKRKIDLMRGARPARFTRSGKISRLRLPNCDTYYAFVIFFFSSFSFSSSRILRFVSFFFPWMCTFHGTSDDSRSGGVAEVLIKKRASLPIKMGKKQLFVFNFFG